MTTRAAARDAQASDADSRWARRLSVYAWATTALLLVQAALAGQFVNTNPGLISMHRYLAEALPLLALGLVVLAWMARARVGGIVLGCSLAIAVLMVLQTGFGFMGRTSPDVAAIHIPLGVTLLGLSVFVATRSGSTTRG